jgi:hypothetical protein
MTMVALKGTKLAVVFVGIGIAVGVVIALAIVGSQTQGMVFARMVEDDDRDNPLLDPDFLKSYEATVRTGAYYKSEVAVGQDTFFVSDAKGGKQPYSFEWKFSDGVVLTAQNSTRSFDTPGTYHFDLTVTDADGKKAGSTNMSISVKESLDGPPASASPDSDPVQH